MSENVYLTITIKSTTLLFLTITQNCKARNNLLKILFFLAFKLYTSVLYLHIRGNLSDDILHILIGLRDGTCSLKISSRYTVYLVDE